MFIQYGNISLPCQSSVSPAFIQSPKNPWLLQRRGDNDWSVTQRHGRRGALPGLGLDPLTSIHMSIWVTIWERKGGRPL